MELLSKTYEITPELQEDLVWTRDVSPLLKGLPKNVFDVWNFCFTEMFNNAVDHSEGETISVYLEQDEDATELTLIDDGVGIFRKLQSALNLPDERQAVLELAKGKFTTDSSRHSGQGIFFTSRMVDSFDIVSGSVYFSSQAGARQDVALEEEEGTAGTTLFLRLANDTSRTMSGIFAEYREGDKFGFDRTVIPVVLAQYGDDQLVSRSQAKRVLARVEKFEHVVFDFDKVPQIGQGFADEIFRVFARAHPEVKLSVSRASREVMGMIQGAKKQLAGEDKATRRKRPVQKGA